jgi:hypothetical protein
VCCYPSTIAVFVDEVCPNGRWRIHEDLRGNAVKESLNTSAMWREMNDMEIEVAATMSATANDRAGGENPSGFEALTDEVDCISQSRRERLVETGP